MVGYSEEELGRLTYEQLTPVKWHAAEASIVAEQILPRGYSRVYEKEYQRKDGTILPVELRTFLVQEGPRPVAMWAIVRDISERKSAEAALAEQEGQLKAFLDAIPSPVCLKDRENRWLLGNPSLFETIGRSAAQSLGKTDREIFDDPAVAAILMASDRRVMESGVTEVVEETVPTPAGLRVFHSTKAPYRDASGQVIGVVVSALDVTDRKRAELALRANEARFRALADASPVGIFETDAKGNNIYLNRVGAQLLGIPADRARGRGWGESIHPEDRDRVLREWDAAVGAGQVFSSEYRFLRPGGDSVMVRGYASAVRDLAGGLSGYVGVMLDVSALRTLEQQLAAASRLAAMGTLVAGIAHEINNPLSVVMGNQAVALEKVEALLGTFRQGTPLHREGALRLLGEIDEGLREAETGGQRIQRIVKDLSTIGKPDAKRARIRVSDVVTGAMRWIPLNLRSTSEIRVEDRGAPDILAAGGQVEQVLINLVTNAVRSLPAGSREPVTIRLGPGAPGMARLEVIDRGPGIDPAILGRIFEPFFTTRDVGQGTGLGLSVCHSIVTAYGGTIGVESTVGTGSTFTVELPAADPGN
jgi:PAS domain S-box-containing protein